MIIMKVKGLLCIALTLVSHASSSAVTTSISSESNQGNRKLLQCGPQLGPFQNIGSSVPAKPTQYVVNETLCGAPNNVFEKFTGAPYSGKDSPPNEVVLFCHEIAFVPQNLKYIGFLDKDTCGCFKALCLSWKAKQYKKKCKRIVARNTCTHSGYSLKKVICCNEQIQNYVTGRLAVLEKEKESSCMLQK